MQHRRIGRRAVLQGLSAAVAAMLVRARSWALAPGGQEGFGAVAGALPPNPLAVPVAPIPPPAFSSAPVYDIFGNHWCLGPAGGHGDRPLLVLAAQAPQAWSADTLSKLPARPWQFLAADEFGYLWIADASRCMRLDPHTPEQGWLEMTADLLGGGTTDRITALGIAGSGAALFALEPAAQGRTGSLVELDRTDRTSVRRMDAPRGVDRIACDSEGYLWLQCKDAVYRRPPAADAWQRRWQLVDRLPAGDHDLSGDVMDGRFYMAGGQNAGWGYPAKPHVFRELMAFDPATQHWGIAARIDQPRFYNGTSWLDGKIWIIAGYARDAQYNPVTLTSVEIWDPATKTLSAGPGLPMPLDNPVALHLRGRIYVAGLTSLGKLEQPCHLLSIGPGESVWHREPDGPSYVLALAGTVHRDSLYLALPGKGLGRFDTTTRAWELIPVAHAARSPQMATYDDEIWIMGGRDIERQDRVTIYRPSDGSWRAGPDLPRPLAWGAGTSVGGHLMVIGGAAGRCYNNRTFCLRKQPITA
jgi:hypothetical protein